MMIFVIISGVFLLLLFLLIVLTKVIIHRIVKPTRQLQERVMLLEEKVHNLPKK